MRIKELIQLCLRYFAILIGIVLITSCSSLVSRTQTRHIDYDYKDDKQDGKVFFVNAEQRAIFTKSFGILCAEPSPDAIASLSSALSLNASQGQELSLGASLAIQNAIGNIGLRTQSIQLMRDALYRVCEGYFSKAINSSNFLDLHERYQDNMIAILAIEQLTGTVIGSTNSTETNSLQSPSTPSTESISGNVSIDTQIAEKSEFVEKTKNLLIEKNKSIAKAKKDIEEISDSTKVEDVELKKILLTKIMETELEVAQLETSIAMAEKELNALTAAKNKTDNNANASANTAIEPDSIVIPKVDSSLRAKISNGGNALATNVQSIQALSEAVTEIVRITLNKKRLTDRCAVALFGPDLDNEQSSQNRSEFAIHNDVREICIDILTPQK